jgi:MFS family permease
MTQFSMGVLTLSPAARAAMRRVLRPGERAIWVGAPTARATRMINLMALAGPLILTLVVIWFFAPMFGLAWDSLAGPNMSRTPFAVALIMGAVFLAFVLPQIFNVSRSARRAWSAVERITLVTDRRLVSFDGLDAPLAALGVQDVALERIVRARARRLAWLGDALAIDVRISDPFAEEPCSYVYPMSSLNEAATAAAVLQDVVTRRDAPRDDQEADDDLAISAV